MTNLSATLNGITLVGSLGSGKVYVNDYTITLEPCTDGYKLTVSKGNETQTATLLCMTAEELEQIRGAEAQRAAAEGLRVIAENNRASAESSRANAETARVNAETARASAEQTRNSNEVSREGAETQRTSNENLRKEAETARVTAETQRNAEIAKTLNMTVSAESTEAGSVATVEKTLVGGVYNLAFGIPKGQDGADLYLDETLTDSTKAAPASKVGELKDSTTDLDNRCDALEDEVFRYEQHTLDITIQDGNRGKYIVPGTGACTSNSASAATDFIACTPGSKVHLEGLYIYRLRAVCGYNENKSYACDIISGKDPAVTEYDFTVPQGVHWLRATTTRDGTVTGYEECGGSVLTHLVNTFNGREGDVTLAKNDVTSALGYTPATPSEVSAVDGKVDNVSDEVENLTDVVERLDRKTLIKPLNLLDGIDVIKAGNRYTVSVKPEDYMIDINGEVWVDVNTGDDANAGTESAPLKSITAALATDANTIYIAEGVYIGADGFNGATVNKPINIIGNGNVICRLNAPFVTTSAFEKYSYEGVEKGVVRAAYSASTSNIVVIDVSKPGTPYIYKSFGRGAELIKTLHDSTEPGYVTALNSIWIRTVDGRDIVGKSSEDCGILVCTHNYNTNHVTFTGDTYIKGVAFELGRTVEFNSQGYLCVDNCRFDCTEKSNGLSVTDAGAVYVFNSSASANHLDGFNYHHSKDADAYEVLEVNCKGFDNGITDESQAWSDNGSTLHNYICGIRVGCEYGRNFGGNIADKGNTKSWNVGCYSHESKAVNTDTGRDIPYNADYWAETKAVMYCYDCTSGGSTYDAWAYDNTNLYYCETEFESVYNSGSVVESYAQKFAHDIADIETELSELSEDIAELQTGKQATLVSGANIKTVNGNSLLGSGNITIEGGGGSSADNWELIETITLTEDTTTLERQSELDGTQYRFKKVMVKITNSVALPAGGSALLYFNPLRSTGLGGTRYSTVFAPVKYSTTVIDNSATINTSESYGDNYSYTSSCTIIKRAMMLTNPVDRGLPIGYIKLYMPSGYPLKSGANIEIYAVRA